MTQLLSVINGLKNLIANSTESWLSAIPDIRTEAEGLVANSCA